MFADTGQSVTRDKRNFRSEKIYIFVGMGCAATQSGAEQVQGKYICTVFDLACIMY